MPHLCTIHMLGGLRVQHADRVLTRFRTQKAGALLAYLAYYPHQAHPREQLLELLWPTLDPNAGRNNLSTELSSLRHQLEPPGVPAGAVLVADRHSVRINPAAIRTDVADFEAQLQVAEQASSENERTQSLQDALDIYAGPLLQGCYEEWIAGERERLTEAYLQALRRLVRSLAQAGELGRALDYAQRAVGIEPLREATHRDLMRLYVASGQVSEALQQYRTLEGLLQQELGQKPSAATRQLLEEIQNQEMMANTAEPPAPARARRRNGEKQASKARATEVRISSPSIAAPSGTVTFLMTDIVRAAISSQERTGESSRAALASLQARLCHEFRAHGGHMFQQASDAFGVAFQSVLDALACAVAAQRAHAAQAGSEQAGELRIRMALHTGDVSRTKGTYQGLHLNQAARLLIAGHGGQILCSEATAGLLHRDLQPGIRVVDLGIYRLRDLPTPERLFQIEYSEMPERAFPRLNADAGHAANLPLQFTRFFGRETELRRLTGLLQLPQTRLVTLTGVGGMGKTRLAIEAATRLVEAFSGAVWFVPLADVSQARLIPSALFEALRLPYSGTIEPLEQAVDALRRQPSLLVLDNFEHLVEEGTDLVRTLLQRTPTLTCLITTRQRLELTCEHEFPVLPLPTPSRAGTQEQLSLYESVQLFVDRAQTVKPDFQITNGNAAAIADLCARLEGIPLAIELAASRAQILTPVQMLSQLANRFEFLVSRRRDAGERHRTMRAAVDWSYHLLSPQLQRFFAQLSVFRGGWSLEAAEAVTQEPLTLDALAQLRECSLILAEDTGEEMRFRMLETLREYAWYKLEEHGDMEAIRTRHRDHFLAFAEQIKPQLSGSDQGRGFDRLETEHDNLRAAMEWCLEEGNWERKLGNWEIGKSGDEKERADQSKSEKRKAEFDMGLRLARAMLRFWHVRGHLSEGRAWFDSLLSRDEGQKPSADRAEALKRAGFLAFYQGDYAASRALFTESLDIYRALGLNQRVADALNDLGLAIGHQGDYAAARSCYEESISIDRELGDKPALARSLGNFGTLARRFGDLSLARELREECLTLKRETGNPEQIAIALNNLSAVVQDQGDYATARVLLEESLEIRRELGDLWRIAIALLSLGELARAQGDNMLAKVRYSESLSIYRKIGHRQDTAMMLRELAYVACDERDYKAARAMLEESIQISRELGHKPGIASSLDITVALAAKLEQPRRAAQLLAAADTIRGGIGLSLSPDEQTEHDGRITMVRGLLSEQDWKVAWAEGRAMTPEQATEYALTYLKYAL